MSKPKLTAEIAHQFETIISAAEREHFGERVPDPAEHAAFLDEVIGQVDAGYTIYRGQWVQVVAPRSAGLAAAAADAQQTRRPRSRWRWAGGIAAGLAALWFTVRLLAPDPVPATAAGAGTPVVVNATATTTVASRVTVTPLPIPTIATGFVTAAGEAAWKRHPNSLKIAGRIFGVYQAPVVQNVWQVIFNPGAANWVEGSTLNWSFAIYADYSDSTTAAWVAGLQPGPVQVEIPIVEPDQHIHVDAFHLTERRVIDRTDTSVFDPTHAGVTIVLPQAHQADKWIELHADRLTPTPVVAPPAASPAGKGGAVP